MYINGIFERLVNRRNIRFNNNNYLSEKEHGYRYYALGYLLVRWPLGRVGRTGRTDPAGLHCVAGEVHSKSATCFRPGPTSRPCCRST